jgi:hypothetical protein
MTSGEQFTKLAEANLRISPRIAAEVRQVWHDLDQPGQVAFAQAMIFLGGDKHTFSVKSGVAARIADRIRASRLMLMAFGVQGSNPHWSSESLRRYVRAVLDTPGGLLEDVFISLCELLGESNRALSPVLANFVKDLVVLCFTENREAYETVAWERIVGSLGFSPAQPLCYFAILAVPPQHLTDEQRAAIIKGLEKSPYWDEAILAPSG